MRRKTITDQIKKSIFERDQYTCQYCGKKGSKEDLELDHLEPLNQGGTSEPDNLVTACLKCNRLKENRTLDEFFEEKERDTRARRLWAWLSLVFAMLGITLSLSFVLTSTTPPSKQFALLTNKVAIQLNEIDSRLNSQEKQIMQLSADFKAATEMKPVAKEAVLDQRLTQTENRLKLLETGLSEDPAKVLSIPLLRKDIESLEKSVASDVSMLKREVDRMYDQSKWFIGLVVTMLLTLIGLAVSTLVSTRK